MDATYFLEERVTKNKLQNVDKWLVKWKWKKKSGRKMTMVTNTFDPWDQ